MKSTYGRRRTLLEGMYAALSGHFGPSCWWPAKTPFEVALGAILTQNTNWRNVEKALQALDAATGLVPDAVAALAPAELEAFVYPAGFFRQKSRKIRNFLLLLKESGGLGHGAEDVSLACFADLEMEEARGKFLAVSGIGPETADCIVLYALGKPSFVVDAYTRRLFHRHGLVEDTVTYAELREFFMDALPPDRALFAEYHALIVRAGKEFCRKTTPRCTECPLGSFLEYAPS
ncbi:MAG: endonuclease III domain-containing protein [Deltaproteobacteria bacterium]|jgi:endonuclease-3 related protein|nr:endonuclease III domain-containing protein [Deltaproteobacteria bacterium]